MQVFPWNMVDIFCIFCVYNFITLYIFFPARNGLPLYLCILPIPLYFRYIAYFVVFTS